MGNRERHRGDDAERDPADFPGVLVNRHAPFTWGASVAKALENAVAVECIAQMALMSLQLEPDLEPIEEELLNKHFRRKHGAGAYYGQTPFEVGINERKRQPRAWLSGIGRGNSITSPFSAISRGYGAISKSLPTECRKVYYVNTMLLTNEPAPLASARRQGAVP